MSDGEECNVAETDQPRKRKSFGRMRDVAKRIAHQSFELGENCLCKRFKCFEVIPQVEQTRILRSYNELLACSAEPWNAQASYLSGLITVLPVARRRSRAVNAADVRGHESSFSYRVRVNSDDGLKDVQVCKKAFVALHGLTKRRLDKIQEFLKMGKSPTDGRGKHLNRAHKLSNAQVESVISHIKSFKGRFSHYTGNKSKKLYLPEELNPTKMHNLYKQHLVDIKSDVKPLSSQSYRDILNKHFNVAFGYPRTDTCSTCDLHQSKSTEIKKRILSLPDGIEKNDALREINESEIVQKLHLKKAQEFYTRKRLARENAKKMKTTVSAICMDYQRNLVLPYIATNDVYYRRKLGFFMFNIHELHTADSLFYCYTEEVGSKGSNEVVSFLDNYINNGLDKRVKKLYIFCDSCGGQNKNYTLIRYLCFVVHKEKKLDEIKITFPIRGHSYMESDRNMAIIKTKTRAEIPHYWVEVVETSRHKPKPFQTIEVDQGLIRDWCTFVDDLYLKKCPFPIRSLKELKVVINAPDEIYHRHTYNGAWTASSIKMAGRNSTAKTFPDLEPGEFLLPPRAYRGLLPISDEKYKDVNHLKQFCINQKAKQFYENLPHSKNPKKRRQNSE